MVVASLCEGVRVCFCVVEITPCSPQYFLRNFSKRGRGILGCMCNTTSLQCILLTFRQQSLPFISRRSSDKNVSHERGYPLLESGMENCSMFSLLRTPQVLSRIVPQPRSTFKDIFSGMKGARKKKRRNAFLGVAL